LKLGAEEKNCSKAQSQNNLIFKAMEILTDSSVVSCVACDQPIRGQAGSENLSLV
jgi:hypothetical protein